MRCAWISDLCVTGHKTDCSVTYICGRLFSVLNDRWQHCSAAEPVFVLLFKDGSGAAHYVVTVARHQDGLVVIWILDFVL